MSNIKLIAKKREAGTKKAKDIRTKRQVPAVIYGPKTENTNVAIDLKEFNHVLNQAGQSTIISMEIEGEKEPLTVLIHEVTRNNLQDEVDHVDFYALDMTKKTTVDIELILEGIEQVEKATGGEVIKNLDTLPVECLPKDLVKSITIDLGEYLKENGDVLHIKDIKLPEGLEPTIDIETSIAGAQEIKEVIEEEPAPAEGEQEEGEESTEDKEEAGQSTGEEEKKEN